MKVLEREDFVIAVSMETGVVTEGNNGSCQWHDLDPNKPFLVPEAPHGRALLPRHPSVDLAVMAWVLAPWCDDFSLRSLAGWLKVELPDLGGGAALVQATRLLHLTLCEHLRAAGLWELYDNLERPVGHILRKMEAAGVPVVRGTIDLKAEKPQTRRQWKGWPARWTSLSGRVHPHWCQTSAVTGRISARDPSLQSLPRRLRGSVAAPKGRLLVAADLSGADFRAAAAMSADPVLLGMFERGEDPYAVIGGGAGREARGKEREVGKQISLAALYGARPRTLARDLQLPVAAVERAVGRYRARFPRLWQWRDELLERFHAGKELRNPFGRRLAPETDAQAVNHPCQSAVADIMKRAMVCLDQRLPADAHMVAQIHDELLVECPEDQAEAEATMMVQEMTRPVPELTVSLAAKVGIGTTWKDAGHAQG